MTTSSTIHLSEVVGALSYALDITEGQPVGPQPALLLDRVHLGMRLAE